MTDSLILISFVREIEAVPAWAGLPDEDQFKSRILSLSKDKRNFLLPPPPGTDFVFDMKVYSSTALATLKEDPNLNKMRFYLVPKEIEELVFWRNYFYRVTLLKQVALSTAGLDSFSEGISDSTSEGSGGTEGGGSNNLRHGRTLSSSVLGYNIYFGKDDVEGPPSRSRPASTIVKESSPPSTTATTTTTTTTTKESSKATVKKAVEKKPEVLFEAEMPDHEEDPGKTRRRPNSATCMHHFLTVLFLLRAHVRDATCNSRELFTF